MYYFMVLIGGMYLWKRGMCLIEHNLGSAGLSISISSTYIVIFTKMQKIATPKNEVCLSDIRKYSVFEIMLTFVLLQISAIDHSLKFKHPSSISRFQAMFRTGHL